MPSVALQISYRGRNQEFSVVPLGSKDWRIYPQDSMRELEESLLWETESAAILAGKLGCASCPIALDYLAKYVHAGESPQIELSKDFTYKADGGWSGKIYFHAVCILLSMPELQGDPKCENAINIPISLRW